MSGGHGHGHGHGHGMTATGRHRRRLVIVFGLTLTVMVVQVIGGVISGSLALLADAGHMLTDAAGIAIALFAAGLATREPTSRRTFGLQRAEVLAALANALLISMVAVLVLREAILRWNSEGEIESGLMLVVALIGGLTNLVCLLLLARAQKESLNMRGAYLEVLGDLLGSAAVVVAAIVIALTGWLRADAVASALIAFMIVPRAWALLREVVDVLLESTPRDVDLDDVRVHMLEIPSVVAVHDLHAWTITSGVPVLSAHIVVDADRIDDDLSCEVLDQLRSCLEGHFDVAHCTFQLEPHSHLRHEGPLHA